jgi:hypothetical protein
MVDTGSGDCSQNMMPAHVSLPGADSVDVEVTTLTATRRKITRAGGGVDLVSRVAPENLAGKPPAIKTGGATQSTANPGAAQPTANP